MEKAEFVSEAPVYYALAIAAALLTRSTVSKDALWKVYSFENDGETTCLVDPGPDWNAAIDWLLNRRMIRELKGSFGPRLYSREIAFNDTWTSLIASDTLPFNHYNMVEDKTGWLFEALGDVADAYRELKISQVDFDKPDSEWQPIQIDTAEPEVQLAIEKLSEAVEEIRKDNGYAANLPEERNYVVEGLEGTVKKLESGTVSAGYIRDAWTRLNMVGRRFAGASLELVITGAKQAIIEMVKSQGGELLRALLHLFH